MRRLFRRSLLWLLPVILIPLSILLVMQYRFLRRLETATASAERNWLRNSVEEVTRTIEARFRASASAALTLPPSLLWDEGALGEHFRRHPVPGAAAFFTLRYGPSASSGAMFDTNGRRRTDTAEESESVKLSTVSWWVAYRLGRVVSQPALFVDERDPRRRVIMRPITDASMHVVGIAGVLLDEAAARREMQAIGGEVLRRRYHNVDMSLRIDETMPKMPGGREYIAQPLGFVFTNWRAGVRDICASPEEIAACNFRLNLIWTGVVTLILLGAIALAIQATARQMRLSQLKNEFVSNVSHELRTPLSSIRVFGEYMRLGRVTREEKIREYGEYIEAESRRLTQLINNILDFSKIETAEKQYHFAETDVSCLVGSTVAAFEVPLREKGFTLTFERAAGLPPLRCDKDAIAQVLVNLIDNAVKYSGERKEIAVAVTAADGTVRISVRDRGIGIAPCEQKKIFEKFYRVGSALVHDVKGSGLGLAIVAHVVKAHGGRVEVESTPGEGSTFTIVLPLPRPGAISISPRTEFA